MYNITTSIFMTYPICTLSPYCFHENTTTIPDISPTIFDITATVCGLQHPLYCCHDNNYGSYPTWHMDDIIHTLRDITITLYETIPQYLWHHNHCIHDIRSPTYDITSRVYDISLPIPVTSQTLCLMMINKQYLSSNTRCRDNTTTISEITTSICVSV